MFQYFAGTLSLIVRKMLIGNYVLMPFLLKHWVEVRFGLHILSFTAQKGLRATKLYIFRFKYFSDHFSLFTNLKKGIENDV